MDVRCQKCGTEYEFEENRIGPTGVAVKCTACGHVFQVEPRSNPAPPARATTIIGAGPQDREWYVRKPGGQMIAFRELTTLQKWIVEGRISRHDEISKNGETWKRLGNIGELEPFFSVVERASQVQPGAQDSQSLAPYPSLVPESGPPSPASEPPTQTAAAQAAASLAAPLTTSAARAAWATPASQGPLSRVASPVRSPNVAPVHPHPNLAPPNPNGPPAPRQMNAPRTPSNANLAAAPHPNLAPPNPHGVQAQPNPNLAHTPNPNLAPPNPHGVQAQPNPNLAHTPNPNLAPPNPHGVQAQPNPNLASSPRSNPVQAPLTSAEPLAPVPITGQVLSTDGSLSPSGAPGVKGTGRGSPAASTTGPNSIAGATTRQEEDDDDAWSDVKIPPQLPEQPQLAPTIKKAIVPPLEAKPRQKDAIEHLGPLQQPIQPASASWDLSFEYPHERRPSAADSVVDEFKRQHRRGKIGWALGALTVLGLAGAYAFAMYGPRDNALRALGEKYAILPKRPIDARAEKLLLESRRALDADTLPSLKHASLLLEQVQQLMPGDPAIEADRAHARVIRAHALEAWALSLEQSAKRIDGRLKAWSAKKRRGQVEPRPSDPDPKALRALAADKRSEAAVLLSSAFKMATAAQRKAPNTLEPARALAAYHEAQRDDRFEEALGRLKNSLEQRGETDPASLFIEAKSLLAKREDDAKEMAVRLLRRTLMLHPTLNRARLLLAQSYLSKNNLIKAKSEATKILAATPKHEGTTRLMAQIQAQQASKRPEDAPEDKPKAEPPSQDDGAQAQAEVPPDPTPQDPPETKTTSPKKATTKAAQNSSAKPKGSSGQGRSFEAWLSMANRLRERDKAAQALNAYEKAAKLKPRSAEPPAGTGWCYLDLGRPQAALHAFRRALKANSRYAEAYFGTAEALRALGDPKEAIKYYKQYLARAPSQSGDRRAAERQIATLEKAMNP